MRQVITRLDDDLHARLKRRAADEGRSLNSLVVEALEGLVERPLSRRELARRKAREMGILAEWPRLTTGAPSYEEVIEAHRGAGALIDEALGWARGHDREP